MSFMPAHTSPRDDCSSLVFRQLFEKESSTYSYLIGDADTSDAVIIDPVDLCADRDVTLAKELGLHLKFGINTHCHAGMLRIKRDSVVY